jgi:hypothetical protein
MSRFGRWFKPIEKAVYYGAPGQKLSRKRNGWAWDGMAAFFWRCIDFDKQAAQA